MGNLDDLLRSARGPKRKLDNPSQRDPTQAYKAVKVSPTDDVKRGKHASLADDTAEDDDEAGPSLPSGNDGPGDDEEGRFFGGGLDNNAIAAMDYLDKQDADETYVEQQYDLAWLKKLASSFRKRITTNAALRAKYEDEPRKFMQSEADLDTDIKTLSILSEHPELYADFAKLECTSALVGLLAHENTDIAIVAIEIIAELTDEDVEASQEQWNVLVSALLEAGLLSLLVSNFSRFDERESEADRSGVYHSLHIIENLAATDEERMCKETSIIPWLVTRIRAVETPTSQNKQYASEVLSILTQTSAMNRRRVIDENAIDAILLSLSRYRDKDPEKGSEEEEYMENLFNCLACLVEEPSGKIKFVEDEGIELCVLMFQTGKAAKTRALRVLDNACAYAEAASDEQNAKSNGSLPAAKKEKTVAHGQDDDKNVLSATTVCTKTVEKEGLKYLFGIFMKSTRAGKRNAFAIERLLNIFASLLRSLPGNSAERIRLLAKFVEKDYEKIARLMELRREYASRVAAFDAALQDQKKGLSADALAQLELESVSKRLEEGLYCLERVDVVLAWLVAEDGGARREIVCLLAERDESLRDVKTTLQAQLDGVLEAEKEERAMLDALVGFLRD